MTTSFRYGGARWSLKVKPKTSISPAPTWPIYSFTTATLQKSKDYTEGVEVVLRHRGQWYATYYLPRGWWLGGHKAVEAYAAAAGDR